jgi:hypothetical protein
MKKYLTVGYAYPVYFLLILGQYFLAEGLDALYNPAASAPAVAQPVGHLRGAPGTAPGTDKEVRTAFTGARKAYGKGR